MTISVTGAAEFNKYMRRLAASAPKTSTIVLRKITLDLKGKAMRLAPVKKGDLRRSAFAENNDSEGTVGFTEVYATRQHEHVEYIHPKGGQAKYLEEPFNENQERYKDMIVQAIMGAMR